MQIPLAESVQANIAPVVAAVTDHDSLLGIDVARPGYATAAAVAVGVGTVLTAIRARQDSVLIDENRFLYSGAEDQSSRATWRARAGQVGNAVLNTVKVVGVSAALIHAGGPMESETTTKEAEVTWIIQANADSTAADVSDVDLETGESVNITRLYAGVEAGLDFAAKAGDSVKTNFILAGQKAQSIGSVRGLDGVQEILEATEGYRTIANLGPKADIPGAIELVKANPDTKRLFVVAAADDVSTRDALVGFNGEANIFAAGQQGTTYDNLGKEATATFNTDFGTRQATAVGSTEELAKAVSAISEESVVVEELFPTKKYLNVAIASALALAAKTFYSTLPYFGVGISKKRRII